MELYPYVRNPMKRALARFVAKRDGEFCQLCEPAVREREGFLELDHRDGDPGNWDPDNLRLLCKPHNLGQRNRQHYVKKSEREKNREPRFQPVFPAQYSAQEGRDHASMRKNWDDWLRGKREAKFPLLEDLKKHRWRTWAKASDVALRAASACKDPEDEVPHSSKTFRVYLEEDIQAGLFDSKVSKNALWVRVSEYFVAILEGLGVVAPEIMGGRR